MNSVDDRGPSGDSVIVDNATHSATGSLDVADCVALGTWSVMVDTRSVEVILDPRLHDALADGEEVEASIDGTLRHVRFQDARRRDALAATAGVSGGRHTASVIAPMPGRIIDVKVSVGDTVARGDTVAVIEAMKMESMIIAPHGGTIVAVHVTPGTVVTTKQTLLRIEG
jgi:biotin carboxyl carrier protein